MHPIIVKRKKYQEKVRIEVERFIRHFGQPHTLAGTLTLRGYYPLEKVNHMWTKFARKLSKKVLSYYALVDFSHPSPHIHYVVAVAEDITENIDLEALAEYQECQRRSRERRGDLHPAEAHITAVVKKGIGSNAALAHYRRIVRAASESAGFGRVMDLWPLYKAPDAIAAYYSRAYRNSARAKSRRPDTWRKKLVFFPRDLPEGIRIGLDQFTLLSKSRAAYHQAKMRLAQVLGVPPGDDSGFGYYFGPGHRAIFKAVSGILNSIPGNPRRWRVAAIQNYLVEKCGIHECDIPGMAPRDTPPEFLLGPPRAA